MGEMHGARRVITFCLLTTVLPTILLIIPLYLRHSLYADVSYAVAESDVLEVIDGISPLFCQEQILRMNSTFRAFQLPQMPPLSHHKKHIKLRKSMDLPDDTMEYWGFYLLAGSKVTLMACSRFDGAGVLVVKGEKNLRTCNIMESQYKHPRYQQKRNNLNLPKKFNLVENVHHEPKSQLLQIDQLNNHKNRTQEFTEEKSKTRDIDELAREIKDFIVNYNNSNKNPKSILQSQTSSGEFTLSTDKNRAKNETLNLTSVVKENIILHPEVHDEGSQTKRVPQQLTDELLNLEEENVSSEEGLPRNKRKPNIVFPGHILDAGVGHGGNANVTELPESSDSSFEDSLKRCYEGQFLLDKDIELSLHCYKNYSLENFKVETVHIQTDGYYYFIFFSDNDHHLNPVHAEFDLYKTTYEHTNYTRGCLNATECRFPISFSGKEIVIVEVPTRDGIEHEDGDSSILTSSCYPRMSVYAIFPVAVLFLILGCAFL